MDIKSLQGVGEVNFGMTSSEVHAILGEPTNTDYQNEYSEGDPTDFYGPTGLSVYYDNTGKCEAIGLSGPEQPAYEGKRLLGMSQDQAESWMEAKDEDAEIDPPDLISNKLGISMYLDDESVVSVLAFREGYYEE